MVNKLEVAGTIGFGLFIGGFFGFVLSRGDLLFTGVGAAVLAVAALIYALTLGQTGGLSPV
ncbi:hypothetical protein [Natronomonas sp.]|uniref:hypothetical protein n=1 Tax=Natronomonas sp. TaxID=2184060 RepID=UPI0026104273|nr:hypothetical protein [Natronomonas sp.]